MNQYFESILDEIIETDGNINSLSIVDLKYYPTHLYKFRDCTKEHNFSMIENEYLWADFPENFYDQSDALVHLGLKSELPKLQKWLFTHLGEIIYFNIPPKGMLSHKNGQSLQHYIESQERFLDTKGRYSAKKAKSIMLTETRKMNHANQSKLQKMYDELESPDFENRVKTAIETALTDIVNVLRKKNLVCSLTERIDNQKMWEEYADKYTGFAIEYDISKVVSHPEIISTISHTFPVTYYKRIPKVPLLPFIEKTFYKETYGKDISIKDTIKKFYKQLIIKKHEYNGEEEWRILSSVQKIHFPLISAVYMGYRISNENEIRLKEICSKHNIPLYKQNFSNFEGKIKFELVRNQV